jgi:hypothetical protein
MLAAASPKRKPLLSPFVLEDPGAERHPGFLLAKRYFKPN